jgi:bisanhydrobacterioruberin hydratase
MLVKHFSEKQILNFSILSILIVHIAGLIGISSIYKDWFLNFTPLTLVFSTYLLFLNFKKVDFRIILSFSTIFLLGFFIEAIGVKTGIIFGNYHYGDVLGYKIFEVPLTIGMNWAALCLSAYIITFLLPFNFIFKTSIAALIPILIDFFIEKVCNKLDFWYWENDIVPLQNYIAWYIFSWIFIALFSVFIKDVENKFAKYFLGVQFFFFFFLFILL